MMPAIGVKLMQHIGACTYVLHQFQRVDLKKNVNSSW